MPVRFENWEPETQKPRRSEVFTEFWTMGKRLVFYYHGVKLIIKTHFQYTSLRVHIYHRMLFCRSVQTHLLIYHRA